MIACMHKRCQYRRQITSTHNIIMNTIHVAHRATGVGQLTRRPRYDFLSRSVFAEEYRHSSVNQT